MFRKNSAFTPTEKETEYVEGIRKRALDADPFPPHNEGKQSDADVLLEAAESLLDDKEHAEALRLIAQARDELDPGPDSRGLKRSTFFTVDPKKIRHFPKLVVDLLIQLAYYTLTEVETFLLVVTSAFLGYVLGWEWGVASFLVSYTVVRFVGGYVYMIASAISNLRGEAR